MDTCGHYSIDPWTQLWQLGASIKFKCARPNVTMVTTSERALAAWLSCGGNWRAGVPASGCQQSSRQHFSRDFDDDVLTREALRISHGARSGSATRVDHTSAHRAPSTKAGEYWRRREHLGESVRGAIGTGTDRTPAEATLHPDLRRLVFAFWRCTSRRGEISRSASRHKTRDYASTESETGPTGRTPATMRVIVRHHAQNF